MIIPVRDALFLYATSTIDRHFRNVYGERVEKEGVEAQRLLCDRSNEPFCTDF